MLNLTSDRTVGMILKGWLPYDGTQSYANAPNGFPMGYQPLDIEVESGGLVTMETIKVGGLMDGFNSDTVASYPGLGQDDGYLSFSENLFLNVGDTVTILPQTITLEANANFNALAADWTFAGQIYFIDDTAAPSSSVAQIPEPSSALLLILSSLSILRRRRRNQ